MANQLAYLYLSLRQFAEPLLASFTSPESLEYFFFRYGWRVTLDDATLAQVHQVLDLETAADRFFQVADGLQQRLDADPDASLSLDEIAQLGEAAMPLLDDIAEFNPSSLSGLLAPLDSADTWSSVGDQLLDGLLEEFLRVHHPNAFLVLHSLGVIRYEPTPPVPPFRIAYTRVVFDWDRLQEALTDPMGALRHTYHWGDAATPFDHHRLLDALNRALHAIGVSSTPFAPGLLLEPGLPADVAGQVRPDVDALNVALLEAFSTADKTSYHLGVDVLPAAPSDDTPPSGLIVRPRLEGAAEQTLPLGDDFALKWRLAASAGDALGVALFPNTTQFSGGQVTSGASLEVASTRTAPWFLLGNPRTARIELHSAALRVSIEGSAQDLELRVQLDTASASDAAGCVVTMPLDGADDFVSETVPPDALQFSFAPQVVWSSKSGFAFNGRPNFEVSEPLNVRLGPISLRNVKVGLTSGSTNGASRGFICRVGLDIAASIGPLDVVIQEVGFSLDLIPYTRQEMRALPSGADGPVVGNLGLDLGFAGPRGVGLSIDAEKVTGGGFLFHDPTQDLYAGVMQLCLHDDLTLTAYGLIATKMPDGSRGYSLLIFITAEGFKPIPLGLG
ncbi:MAG TPA: DUF6603 domain-containing protein, partial [Chloroflexota bacterium]